MAFVTLKKAYQKKKKRRREIHKCVLSMLRVSLTLLHLFPLFLVIACIWFQFLPPFTLSLSTWIGPYHYLSNGVRAKGLRQSVGGIFLVTRIGGEGGRKTKP